jgi:hypothetical protein
MITVTKYLLVATVLLGYSNYCLLVVIKKKKEEEEEEEEEEEKKKKEEEEKKKTTKTKTSQEVREKELRKLLKKM